MYIFTNNKKDNDTENKQTTTVVGAAAAAVAKFLSLSLIPHLGLLAHEATCRTATYHGQLLLEGLGPT